MQQAIHMSHRVAATWSGTGAIFHQTVWIDAISKPISFIHWDISIIVTDSYTMSKYLGHFLMFGFVFILWASKLGSATRIFEGLESVQRGRRSKWTVTVDSRRYGLLESCNRLPPWPTVWMPVGPELSEIFHRPIWIDDFKTTSPPSSSEISQIWANI